MDKEVKITWVDSKMWGAGWESREEAMDFKLPICVSVGLILKEDDEMILLAQTQSDGDVANLIGICKATIKSRKERND